MKEDRAGNSFPGWTFFNVASSMFCTLGRPARFRVELEGDNEVER